MEGFDLLLDELHATPRGVIAQTLGWQEPVRVPGLAMRVMGQIRAEKESAADPRILGAVAGLAFLLLACLVYSAGQLFTTVDGSSIGLFWLVVGISLCGTIPTLVLTFLRDDQQHGFAWSRLRRVFK